MEVLLVSDTFHSKSLSFSLSYIFLSPCWSEGSNFTISWIIPISLLQFVVANIFSYFFACELQNIHFFFFFSFSFFFFFFFFFSEIVRSSAGGRLSGLWSLQGVSDVKKSRKNQPKSSFSLNLVKWINRGILTLSKITLLKYIRWSKHKWKITLSKLPMACYHDTDAVHCWTPRPGGVSVKACEELGDERTDLVGPRKNGLVGG